MTAFDDDAVLAPALNLDQVRAALTATGWDEPISDDALQNCPGQPDGNARLHLRLAKVENQLSSLVHSVRRGRRVARQQRLLAQLLAPAIEQANLDDRRRR